MKKNITLYVLLFWVILIFSLQYFNIIHFDINSITQFIRENKDHAAILFTLLFSLRILLFIPSSVFLAVGILFFSPLEVMIISLISMFITESAVYVVGRRFSNTPFHLKIKEKYPSVVHKLENNQKKFLFLLGAIPTAPTDVACFLVASIGMKYRTYIAVVLLANTVYASYYAFLGGFIKYLIA